jgi:hypothetical protein
MKTKPKTQKEIKAEIKALEACKTYAPSHSVFGDDNHRKLDLQVEYLKGEIDITSDEYQEYSIDEQTCIEEARDWEEGYQKESPSSGWDTFKKKHGK